jgi:hypothetical protein
MGAPNIYEWQIMPEITGEYYRFLRRADNPNLALVSRRRGATCAAMLSAAALSTAPMGLEIPWDLK